MKATANNTTGKNAVQTLKNIIKADALEWIELVKYGIQIYNVIEGEEYNVIIKAEKHNGRYYFVTREGARVAWSSLDADKLAHACQDFIDQINADQTTETSENTTTQHNVTAARVNHIATVIADAVGVAFSSRYPSRDMVLDLQRFYKWQNPATVATDEMNPADIFYIAIRKQGSESGARCYVRERCKVLGRPVYVLRVAREYSADGDELAGRYCLTVRACNDNDTKTVTNANNNDNSNGNAIDDKNDTGNAIDTTTTAESKTSRAARLMTAAATAAKKAAAAILRAATVALKIIIGAAVCALSFAVFYAVVNLCAAALGSHIVAVLLLYFPVGLATASGFELALIKLVNKTGLFE